MNAIEEATAALIASGMTPAAAASLLARAAIEIGVGSPSKAALRTRRWRQKRASQSVTERHTVTPNHNETKTSPTVTNRHKPSQCDVALSLSIEEDSQKEGKRERAKQLCDGWRPPSVDWAVACDKFGGEGAELEFQKFTDHAKTKGRTAKDWSAAWRNWIRRAVEYRGGMNGNGTSARGTHPHANGRATGTDAILAGVAAAAERRSRERRQGAVPSETTIPGEFDFDPAGAGRN